MHGTLESEYKVEVRTLGEIASFADALHDLAGRALEPNVFYEPAFAAAAAPVFGRDVIAGLIWRRGRPTRLAGFFPARVVRRRYGLKIPMLVGWTHPFAPLGAPLVDRDCGPAVVRAWFDHVATEPGLPELLLYPFLPAAGPLARAFDVAVASRMARSADFNAHQRALLAPAADREHYLDHAIAHKKRKELRRQRKRLALHGSVSCDLAAGPAAVAAALIDFFALEARGWKGRAKTAALCDEAIHRFVEHAVCDLAAEGKARVSRLMIGTHAAAAIVTLQSGDTAWCWKIAYDESLASASPGVQVLLDVTQGMLDDPRIARADSCATPDHPMIDHVWRERLELSDRLIHVGPCSRFGFRLVCGAEHVRRMAITAAKRLRDRYRQPRSGARSIRPS
jgi:hypothetical protein